MRVLFQFALAIYLALILHQLDLGEHPFLLGVASFLFVKALADLWLRRVE